MVAAVIRTVGMAPKGCATTENGLSVSTPSMSWKGRLQFQSRKFTDTNQHQRRQPWK
jgi:hypothetical protein